MFHHRHRREDLTNLAGEVGVAIDVFFERRPLPGAVTVEELFGQFKHQART